MTWTLPSGKRPTALNFWKARIRSDSLEFSEVTRGSNLSFPPPYFRPVSPRNRATQTEFVETLLEERREWLQSRCNQIAGKEEEEEGSSRTYSTLGEKWRSLHEEETLLLFPYSHFPLCRHCNILSPWNPSLKAPLFLFVSILP